MKSGKLFIIFQVLQKMVAGSVKILARRLQPGYYIHVDFVIYGVWQELSNKMVEFRLLLTFGFVCRMKTLTCFSKWSATPLLVSQMCFWNVCYTM